MLENVFTIYLNDVVWFPMCCNVFMVIVELIPCLFYRKKRILYIYMLICIYIILIKFISETWFFLENAGCDKFFACSIQMTLQWFRCHSFLLLQIPMIWFFLSFPFSSAFHPPQPTQHPMASNGVPLDATWISLSTSAAAHHKKKQHIFPTHFPKV